MSPETRKDDPTRDARVRIERVFRIVEMIGVIAILLAALPPWGVLVCVVLGFLLTWYVLLVIFDEIEIALVPTRDHDKVESIADLRHLGIIRMSAIIVVASASIWGIFTAIIFLAAQVRQVID